MHLSFQTLVLAALGLECILAQPAHRHQHKHKREDKGNDGIPDEIFEGLPWDKICADGNCDPNKAPVTNNKLAVNPIRPAVAASSGPSSSPVVQPSSPSSSSTPSSSGASTNSGSGSCIDVASIFDKKSRDNSRDEIDKFVPNGQPKEKPDTDCMGGCTAADGDSFSTFGEATPPAFQGETDGYRGNVGSPYGHNMYPLSDCDVSGQKYAITFTNSDSKQIEVAMWNKVGDDFKIPDRKQTGHTRNAFWKFSLEAGQSAAFAVQANSQIAFSQACNRGGIGEFDCAWGEADFGNLNNKGWSGYDRSTIRNSAGNTGLLTMCAEGHGCSSKEAHSFVTDKQTDAGGDLSIPAEENAHMRVTMGG